MEENLKNKRSSSHRGKMRYFDLITTDLTIKILSKLPSAKSMARCRCVSKLWSALISRPNYKQLFPTKSLDPPRFLVAFRFGGNKFSFYTCLHPEKPDETSSLVATHHTNSIFSKIIPRPVQGLVCHQRDMEDNSIQVVISNPITGQYVALPIMRTEIIHARSYLGYDPIEKQFKVLYIAWVLSRGTKEYKSREHRVLTLLENGSRNLLWRKITCCIPQYPLRDDGICIDGVLYYISAVNELMVYCFDVRSEKFHFATRRRSTMINQTGVLLVDLIDYKGKLSVVENDQSAFVLWVLEDSKENKWSKHVYEKPMEWLREIYSCSIYVSGVTGTGEVVLCPRSGIYYILYYNHEEKKVVKVEVEVPPFEGYNSPRVYIFPNYVEDLKLM